jgi:hypothetical protein
VLGRTTQRTAQVGDARAGGEAGVHGCRGLERKLERPGRRLERRASCRSGLGGGGTGDERESGGAAPAGRGAVMARPASPCGRGTRGSGEDNVLFFSFSRAFFL